MTTQPNSEFPPDAIGRKFDPAKFRLGGGGKPRLDTFGRFVNLNGGRPKKAAATVTQGEDLAGLSQPAPDFADVERLASPGPRGSESTAPAIPENPTAESVIGIVQTALVLIGDEEGVLSDAEKMALRPPLVRVLKKYDVGADILPAEAELALCCAMLIVSRLQRPKTATWFAKAKAWATGLFFRGKGELLRREIRDVVHEPAKA